MSWGVTYFSVVLDLKMARSMQGGGDMVTSLHTDISRISFRVVLVNVRSSYIGA